MTSIKLVMLLGVLSVGLPVTAVAQDIPKTVVLLDPGHGGTDSGAVGTNLCREKHLVMDVVREVLQLDRALGFPGLELYLTRYSDTLISLHDRGRLSKGLKADLFVSIHGNNAPNPKAQGLEVFVWKPFPNAVYPFGEASESLAGTLASEMQEKLEIKNRGIKRANFQVLRDNRSQCPAVLLELGFLSNSEEAAYLASQSGIRTLALAILMGISNYVHHVGTD